MNGLNFNRIRTRKDDPRFSEEWKFKEAWDQLNAKGRYPAVDLILGDGSAYPASTSLRDKQVAATIIQWLGTECGQAFLKNVQNERNELCVESSHV